MADFWQTLLHVIWGQAFDRGQERPLVVIRPEFWVVHVFQKKSTRGIKTPKAEIDLVKDRMKRLKEMLR